MKKAIFILSVFIFIAGLAEAQISIFSEERVEVFTGTIKDVEIKVKNEGRFRDIVTLSIWPSIKWAGILASLDKYSLNIPPKEVLSVKLRLKVDLDAEEVIVPFLITARSLNTDQKESITIRVKIVRSILTFISSIDLESKKTLPNKTFSFEVKVTNLEEKESLNILKIELKKNEKLIKSWEREIKLRPKSASSFEFEFFINPFQEPGIYKIEAELLDKLNQRISFKSNEFEIKEVKLKKDEAVSKERKVSLMSVDVIIRIKNTGNVDLESFILKETIPKFAKSFLVVETEINRSRDLNGFTSFEWVVPTLKPGEEYLIKYKFTLWYVWLGLIFIGSFVYMAFKVAFLPTISKSYGKVFEIKKGREIFISLDIRNSSFKDIKNVVVQDFVPQILRLVKKFDTLAPEIKQQEGETILTWKIGSLKPKEERVLTYRIKPVVEIAGSLKLPAATLIFSDRKGKKKSVVSRPIVIKPKA